MHLNDMTIMGSYLKVNLQTFVPFTYLLRTVIVTSLKEYVFSFENNEYRNSVLLLLHFLKLDAFNFITFYA